MAADQERADRIRALKQSRPDLTWRRIADHVGVTERSAADWQTKGGIEYANAEKLAELFEVDVDYIWRGPATDTPSPFAPADATEDRLDRMEARLDEHARKVEELLARQSRILERIEAAIDRADRVAKRDEESARRLGEAAERATAILQDAAAPQGQAPRTRAKSGNR